MCDPEVTVDILMTQEVDGDGNSQCTRCRSRPSAPGRKRCAQCAAEEREYDAKRRASGWCVECRVAKRAKGKQRCKSCLELRRVAAAQVRAERVESGLCVTCGAKAVEGLTLCARHREYYRARGPE